MLSPTNEGAGPEGASPKGSTHMPRYRPRRRPSSAVARSATKVAAIRRRPLSSASTPRRHSAEYALPASSTTAIGTNSSWRFMALPRIDEVDDGKDHRRHDENGLAPQGHEGALPDREDAEEREEGAPRGSALAAHAAGGGSRSARPV